MTHRWHTKKPRQRLSDRVRRFVLHRDGYMCRIRGDRCTGRAAEVDHIVPVSRGGTDDPTNLRAACKACNAQENYRARGRGGGQSRLRRPEKHPGDLS
ncbi:HNH endonuclease signature motif containing protein [Rhodococcus sp. OK519]|uniref:HNH endonuclease n=1 Tax=Rhodococcus sp. OK519 TaxID=2135729 RepID=UPI000D3CADF8